MNTTRRGWARVTARPGIWLICAAVLASVPAPSSAAGLDALASSSTQAEPYDPACGADDPACEAWAKLRTARPFPYQGIEVVRLTDGSLAIVILEPPPVLSRAALDVLLRTAFGDDLLTLTHRRWRIGFDGWLEDVVLHVESGSAQGDPLREPVTRDRVAFLHVALFGTAFGAGLLDAGGGAGTSGPPNVEIGPEDLRLWLLAAKSWIRLDQPGPPVSWKRLAQDQPSGSFVAEDGTLVVLTFPAALLQRAPSRPEVLSPLRIPFRTFAVATDLVVGVYRDPSGMVAVAGRPRTLPVQVAPPLRFETFALIASDPSDQLSQSYERNAVFAGKLLEREHLFHDWAPAYLSDVLVDTELGALLETTDQLLKSWSEAGLVEYQYFNYPRPASFPFGPEPLSDLLTRKVGSGEVLFNWNTSGATVLVSTPRGTALTATRTGSLPITYGSGLEKGAPKLGHLAEQENIAYAHFASRRDPNLSRVVSYTMLYQFCRASAPSPTATRPPAPARSAVRSAATQALLERLLRREEVNGELQARFDEKWKGLRTVLPGIELPALAELLADRFSPGSLARMARYEAHRKAYLEEIAALQSEHAEAKASIQGYNALVREYGGVARGSSQINAVKLAQHRAEAARSAYLEHEARIERRAGEGQAEQRAIQALGAMREVLWEAASPSEKEAVRAALVAAHDHEPDGSIKTPSIVLSWMAREVDRIRWTGGADVDAHPVRLEPSAEVEGIELTESPSGKVVRYNPARAAAVEAHANELARAIEHGRIRSSAELEGIANRSPRPARSAIEALELPPDRGVRARWTARLANRTYERPAELVADLDAIAKGNDCCVFVAYDDAGVAYAVERSPKQRATTVRYELRDAPSVASFVESIARRSGADQGRSVVFLDVPESHVRSLALNVTDPARGLTAAAERLGSRVAGEVEPRTEALVTKDLSGRLSTLAALSRRAKSVLASTSRRLTGRQSATSWRSAKVSIVGEERTAELVDALGWEPARDGVPRVVELSFREPGATSASLVVGVPDVATSPSVVQRVALERLAPAAEGRASLAQFAASVRNDLEKATAAEIRRLIIVVKDGETRILFGFIFTARRPDGSAS